MEVCLCERVGKWSQLGAGVIGFPFGQGWNESTASEALSRNVQENVAGVMEIL